MKKLTLICALVMVLGIATVASAEVQRIRVSGDINSYGVWSQYDTFYYDAAGTADTSPDATFLATTVGLNFDADLTDFVSGRLRLVNQRLWDYDDGDTTAMDIGVAEAYVTLQEMLYEPLTVSIGRMPLYYGRGFLLASNVIDPEGDLNGYGEFSQYDAFDAIKAVLAYDMATIDLVYVKVNEDDTAGIISEDDYDMWLVNVGHQFDDYDAEAELYYLGWHDRDRGNVQTINYGPRGGAVDGQTVMAVPSYQAHTIGARGSAVPVDRLLVFGELAYQFGDYGRADYDVNNNVIGVTTTDIGALGGEVGGEYTFNYSGDPMLGFTYSYREGEDWNAYPREQGDYDQFWTPFMRKPDTAIFGWNGRYFGNFLNSVDDDDTAWDTNMHQILVTGSVKPLVYWDIEDVLLSAKYAHFIFEEAPVAGEDEEAGDELDINVTYDYTEDVQFGLLAGWFWPGDYYKRGNPNNQADAEGTLATHVVGSCKLTF